MHEAPATDLAARHLALDEGEALRAYEIGLRERALAGRRAKPGGLRVAMTPVLPGLFGTAASLGAAT